MYSFHLRGGGITAPRAVAMEYTSKARSELSNALAQAEDGTGAPVVVVCRAKVGAGGESGDLKAAWAAYNREYTRRAMAHARELVAASKDMHPGPVPGCDFARWVLHWFDRLAVQDVLQRGGKDCDFDSTTVADLAMLKLFVTTGSAHYGSHIRLNVARRLMQSAQLNVVRMALASVPWKEGGECQFWDAIQETFIDLHQAALGTSMTAARVLDTLTLISLNIDLIRDMGEVAWGLLEGASGPLPIPRGGIGSVRRGDIDAMLELYERSGSNNVNGSGEGLSHIDRFRVGATAVPVVFDQDAALDILDSPTVHKVQGMAGNYVESNFKSRLAFAVEGPGDAEIVAAKVRLDGERAARCRRLPPVPDANHTRTIIVADGRGPLGGHRSLRCFRQSHGRVTVHVPDRGEGPWAQQFKEVTFETGAVLFRDSANPDDVGLSGAIVLSSRLKGAPAPRGQSSLSTPRRLGDAVYEELAGNIEAARQSGSPSWVAVAVLCPVEPELNGMPPMTTLRELLGLKPGDSVRQLTLYVWRDRNPVVPCDVTEVNKVAQRHRFAQTKSRHLKDKAAQPESSGSGPMTAAGRLRREAMVEGNPDAGMGPHFARVLKDRGLGNNDDTLGAAATKTVAPCASCHRSGLTAGDGAMSTGFSLTEDMLSESDSHRRWMIKREPENGNVKHLLQQLAGDAPVVVRALPAELAGSPAQSPGAGTPVGRAPSPHTPAARAEGSGAHPIATPDAMTAWQSELALLTSEQEAASNALTRATARQDQADALRSLANTAVMSPAEIASKTGACRRAVEAVRTAEVAEQAATEAFTVAAKRGPVAPTAGVSASNLEDAVPMPPLFE